jgi:hypothetical protein
MNGQAIASWLAANEQTITSCSIVLGVIIGLTLLIYSARQLQSSVRVSKGQFMLDLERMSTLYDTVHR